MPVSTDIQNITIGYTGATAAYLGDTLIWPLYSPDYAECGCIFGPGNVDAYLPTPVRVSHTLKWRFAGEFKSTTGGLHIGANGTVDSNDYRLFLMSATYTYLDMGNKRLFLRNQPALKVNIPVDITVFEMGLYDNIAGELLSSGATPATLPEKNVELNVGRLKIESFKAWETSGGTDVLIFDGVPMVRLADKQPGLYDNISNQFYTTTGTTIDACDWGGAYENDYLTLDFVSGGSFHIYGGYNNLYYSKNGGGWEPLQDSTTDVKYNVNVNAGDSVRLKRQYTTLKNNDLNIVFSGSTYCNISGNIMSMCYGDNFKRKKSLPVERVFTNLFNQRGYGGNGPVDASRMVLPATSLTNTCYSSLFNFCLKLVNPPQILPAEALTDFCYDSMFVGCGSLKSAPVIAATTLAPQCYQTMFMDCSSLTGTPVLIADTLVEGCYTDMFRGCSALKYVECYSTPVNTGLYPPTLRWLKGVKNTGTFKAKQGTEWVSGENGIPANWTVEYINIE